VKPIEQLIPEVINMAMDSHFEAAQAIQAIRSNPIIPITIIPSAEKYNVAWLNVEDYQFTEWKFKASIKNFTANQSKKQAFTADIQLLASDEILTDCLYPSGFIFHVSKCGSTLLAKALAQAREHIVMTEASPLHENLWRYLTNNWQAPVNLSAENLALIKNLILSMGRRRTAEQQAYFIKFRSWNTVFFDIITRIFPDVPCLFLYRDPNEVLVSSLHKPPEGQLRLKGTAAAAFMLNCPISASSKMSHLEHFGGLLEHYFSSILNSPYGDIVYLNYNQLSKQNFAKLFQQVFRCTSAENQLTLMQSQFDYYSKDDSEAARFVSDTAEKQNAITPEIKAAVEQNLSRLYNLLEKSNKNFVNS
jgi:hypothetical protein